MPDLSILLDGFPGGHGPLGLLSSDEFTAPAAAFDRALHVQGKTVGLILDADHDSAAQNEARARAHFGRLGAETLTLDMHTNDALPDYDIAYVAGGSPSDLLRCLRDSARWLDVRTRWKHGKALAGSSAGAMVLCTYMLTPKPGDRVPTKWSEGLGPIATAALAVHARTRPKEWLDEVARNAPVRLLAIDDATGIVLGPGDSVITAGEGRVWFVPRPSRA
ncbi:MAG: Type 1 glutamine amidotransferase-like domain-containing protein [Actinomycetota bacterium]